jgi:hypothetical protein
MGWVAVYVPPPSEASLGHTIQTCELDWPPLLLLWRFQGHHVEVLTSGPKHKCMHHTDPQQNKVSTPMHAHLQHRHKATHTTTCKQIIAVLHILQKQHGYLVQDSGTSSPCTSHCLAQQMGNDTEAHWSGQANHHTSCSYKLLSMYGHTTTHHATAPCPRHFASPGTPHSTPRHNTLPSASRVTRHTPTAYHTTPCPRHLASPGTHPTPHHTTHTQHNTLPLAAGQTPQHAHRTAPCPYQLASLGTHTTARTQHSTLRLPARLNTSCKS